MNDGSWPLNPRAVTVQGIGYGSLWVALQGFWPTSPYRRAPLGPGFGARPFYSARLEAAPTVRAGTANTTRHGVQATSRPGQTNTLRNTTRPRRC